MRWLLTLSPNVRIPKRYLTYLLILTRGRGGPNVLGIGRMGRVNGYLIKDVSVNIEIKLKYLPDTSQSKIQLTFKNKQSYMK